MRTRGLLRFSLLLLAIALPVVLRAQFQDPTPDELKMTADPKAPGAAAVYLNVTEITNRDLNFESYYARIKVLTEKGKELATVELPYQKHVYGIADVRARTIQPDGTVVPLVGKPADLVKAKGKGYQEDRKVFNLPSVQVGSILEYYFQLRYSSEYVPNPYWEIQYPYLVRKAHYECIGCNGLSTWTALPMGVALGHDRLGHPTLDLENVPPAPDEEWMPPIWEILYKAVFYMRYSSTPEEFWKNEGNGWSGGVDAFVQPSKSFQAVVNGLIAPSDSGMEKAKKLYSAVQSLDNTDFSREKSEAERKKLKLKEVNRAEDVWTQKSGTRTEIALLYLSMLRAAGLTAYAMKVVDRSQRIFIPTYLDWDQFDATVVILSLDGKDLALDPGEKMCPFLTLHWSHSKTGGVRQGAKGSSIATTPQQAYGANTTNRIADVTLDDQGAITANLRFVMAGQEALYWRQKALENDEAEAKKQFDDWIAKMVPDGVEAHIDHFEKLDDPDANLVAVIQAHGTVGAATSKRLLVPGLFFETRASHPFVGQDQRITPVDMHYGDMINDEVTYRLPQDVTVESAPQASKIPWEGHAVLVVKLKTDTGQITITRTLARAFTFAGRDEYQTLHDFYQKVATADQQQIVLARAPAAKGE
jgi:Domain of Unknown Function with PDB structure (DUF3857)/Transglutaminase-like superfamily